MSLALETKVAVSAVLRACGLAQSVFHKLVTEETITKKDKSPVTVADYSAQAVINTVLATHFPSDPIVGEEDSSDLRSDASAPLRAKICELANAALAKPEEDCPAVGGQENKWGTEMRTEAQLLEAIDRGSYQGGNKGRMWALDPIDGTKGFLRGGQYAVCLALIVDGQVQLGVMGCPNLPVDVEKKDGEKGVIFVAAKGTGAFQRSFTSPTLHPISMPPVTSLSDATFCESVEAGHSSHDDNAKIAHLLGITREPVRMDSQAKYGSIARGDGNIYLRLPVGDGSYQEKIWDHASGALLVAEAGGLVTDLFGRPLDFGRGRTLSANKGVVAARKDVHPKVIEAVKEVIGDRFSK